METERFVRMKAVDTCIKVIVIKMERDTWI